MHLKQIQFLLAIWRFAIHLLHCFYLKKQSLAICHSLLSLNFTTTTRLDSERLYRCGIKSMASANSVMSFADACALATWELKLETSSDNCVSLILFSKFNHPHSFAVSHDPQSTHRNVN